LIAPILVGLIDTTRSPNEEMGWLFNPHPAYAQLFHGDPGFLAVAPDAIAIHLSIIREEFT